MSRFFGRFGCNNCSASFHTQHGSPGDADEWRCEQCDDSIIVARNGESSSPSPCSKCGGQRKRGLEPRCPRCGSRDVLLLVPGMFFD